VTAGTDSHPDDPHVAAPGRVRQVAPPAAARALSTLSHVDCEDAFGIAPRHQQVVRDLLQQASCPERPPRQP
jgi:hypothetical protein